jgi:hypothetical protein
MVTFSECIAPASDEEVDQLEGRVGLKFPSGLRRLFSTANGGRPTPSVFRDGEIDTDVSECLALRDGRGSALWTYELFVLSKRLVPSTFFPFAVDSGGDCFFVDCSSAAASVFLYVHDTAFEHLCPLDVSIDDFWERLIEE